MKNNRRMLVSIFWVLLGIGLIVATTIAKIDAFWSGMGSAFIFIGSIQIFRWVKYIRDEKYREQMDINANDERNRYLATKAWAWAGYLFVLICAVACILLRIAGQNLWSFAASGAICLIITLYWVSYLILKRKN